MLRTLKGDKKIETLFSWVFIKRKNILLKGYDFEKKSFFDIPKGFKSVDRNRIKDNKNYC